MYNNCKLEYQYIKVRKSLISQHFLCKVDFVFSLNHFFVKMVKKLIVLRPNAFDIVWA